MDNLYDRIEAMCEKLGINVTVMCREAGVNRGNLTDLKMGRQSGLSAKNLDKIAEYFNVSVGFLLGRTDDQSVANEKSPVYDDEALELMEEMHKRPELKALFSTSKRASKEDIEAVDQLLKRMARGGGDED